MIATRSGLATGYRLLVAHAGAMTRRRLFRTSGRRRLVDDGIDAVDIVAGAMEPDRVKEPGPEVFIREAREDDIPALVALFAADALGGHADTTEPAALPDYLRAFRRIVASPNDTLYVAELDGEVVGTFQTTLIPSMVGRGATNFNIEAVQTRSDMRGKGIGAAMFRFAIERGREAGARLAQLTSNKTRTDAHRFYERMGFSHSHAGFKMKLRY